MTCEQLKNVFDEYKNNSTKLPYANPVDDGQSYGGWVSNFHIHRFNDNEMMKLDLQQESDLFLLFVLSVAWSRSGRWENSAFFVSYLKLIKGLTNMDLVSNWINNELRGNFEVLSKRYVEEEKNTLVLGNDNHADNNGARCEISLRNDILSSVKVLFQNWESIKQSLEQSNINNNYMIFINKMRSIDGLGPTKNGVETKMSMKILLILRELRIQEIFSNIPGELCCVPDARVKEVAKQISDLHLCSSNLFEGHIKNSKIIYQRFGDWYDVPLFAFDDLK